MIDVFFYCLQRLIYFLGGRKHFSVYKAMMANRFKEKDRLALLLSWARNTIPRYRNLADKNTELKSTDFPITTKRDIQERLHSFINPKYRSNDMIRSYTGGSTGKPTVFYHTRAFRDIMSAGVWRAWTWAGWKPGQSILYIWGAPDDIGTDWRYRVRNFVQRKTVINAFNCSESDYRRRVRTYNKKKPWPAIVFEDGGGIVEVAGGFSQDDVVGDIPHLVRRLEYYYENRGETTTLSHDCIGYSRKFDIRNMVSQFKTVYEGLI